MEEQLITPLVKEAIHRLCATFQVFFHGNTFSSVEVVGMKKPTWEEVAEKASEIEFEGLKPYFLKTIKESELEARIKLTGDASSVLVSQWSNQKNIAEKIIAKTATDEEIFVFQTEIDLRGLGETLEDFSKKVLEKSSNFILSNSKITGALKKSKNDIIAAKTRKEAQEGMDVFLEFLKKI